MRAQAGLSAPWTCMLKHIKGCPWLEIKEHSVGGGSVSPRMWCIWLRHPGVLGAEMFPREVINISDIRDPE